MLTNLLNDIRYAVRGFALRPTFASIIVLTLAVGIGVNVAVFSLYDQLMLRQLPVSRPAELVNFVGAGPKAGMTMCGGQGGCDEVFSYPMFRDLEQADGPFAGIAGSRMIGTNLSFGNRTTQGTAMLVTDRFFAVLGVGPALGRVLDTQDEGAPGEASTVVLSYDYWSNALGADPAILGKTITVNGKPLEIVGVAPRGFAGTAVGERPQVFVPITFDWLHAPGLPALHTNRFAYWLYMFGRLKPSVSIDEAQALVNVPYRRIVNEVEASVAPLRPGQLEQFRGKSIELQPGANGQSGAPRAARTPLAVFFAATATILVIACVNLANLMFARGAARSGEMAVRTSMGAAPRRLLGMLAVEALLLAALAAVSSLPVAYGVLQGVGAFIPSFAMGAAPNLTLDGRAVAAAFAIAASSAVLFALIPMLKLVATDPGQVLQANGARTSGGKGLGRLRFALATLQIALSMVLLVLAGLFTQSLANVARVDLGMRTESVLSFGVAPSLNGYTPQHSEQVFEQIEQQLKTQPGVMSVTSSMVSLLSGGTWSLGVNVEGYESPATEPTSTNMNYVGTGFLQTFEIPLLAGRDIAEADTAGSPLVAIVNQSFAAKYGLGDNPIGKRIDTGNHKLDIEIVGLFKDAAYNRVKAPFTAQFALPRRQSLQSGAQGMNFYVRTAQAPEALVAAIPRIVAQVDPNLPATNAQTFSTQIRKSVQTDRLLTTLSSALAFVATLLAAIGLYGVLSYTVAQRTREIGVRLALGAEPARVRAMVLKQVGWMTFIGMPIGLVGALLLGRLAAALLFGLAPTNPIAFVAAGVVLTAVLFGASYLPARRASRVDPVVALRSE